MKSFVAYPIDSDKGYLSPSALRSSSGILMPHIELFRKVSSIEGCVIKCGIAAEEGFTRFAALKQQPCSIDKKMVAFEKFSSGNNPCTTLLAGMPPVTIPAEDANKAMMQKGRLMNVEFIPGHVDDTIAGYLIDNPECKISYLNIDLDDYEMTTTSLEFLFPRIVTGGILILDNYYKRGEEFRAVNDYFNGSADFLKAFSAAKGPHYFIRN